MKRVLKSILIPWKNFQDPLPVQLYNQTGNISVLKEDPVILFGNYEGVEPIKGDNLENRLKQVIVDMESMGPVNLKAVEEWEEISGDVKETVEKKNKLRKEKRAVVKLIKKLEVNKRQSFMNIYRKTANQFKEVFCHMLSLSHLRHRITKFIEIYHKEIGRAIDT